LHGLWEKVLENGLVEGVCKACSNKMQTLNSIDAMGLALLSEMSGHPGIASYRHQGFDIITF
jgi:predicted DCC family thiol-disulfide oxidoreductase YuxK